MSIIVVWDLGLELPENLSFFFFFSNIRHWALFFSAADMFLVFLLGALLGLEAALGASLGLDEVALDLIASPISFCALGAGATTSSSSSSSEECFSNSAIGSTFLH